MNLLLDLNIVLDVVLQRQPWYAESSAVWDAHVQGRIRGHLVATSLTNLFYITRRILGADQARRAVQHCLRTFAILTVDGPVLQQADALPGKHFEDNLQIAAASAIPLDGIVTRDSKGFAGSPVTILSPAEVVTQIASGTPCVSRGPSPCLRPIAGPRAAPRSA